MKHSTIEASCLRIAAPAEVVHAMLLRQIPVLTAALPHRRLEFCDPHAAEANAPETIRISFHAPRATDLVCEYAGLLTFGVYAPRAATEITGWVSGGGGQSAAVASDLERALIGTAPTLCMASLSMTRAAINSLGLAGVLPDTIGRRDPDLRRLSGREVCVQRPLWLSYAQQAENPEDRATALNWIRASISETSWLNTPVA
ncbi:MAG: hypothetical protein JXR14_06300 [Paracoccaceae bacterium]